MATLARIAAFLCRAAFVLSAAFLCLGAFLAREQAPAMALAAAVAVVAGLACLPFGKRPLPERRGDPIMRLHDRMILRPVPPDVDARKREHYARDLAYQGFLPIGLFQVVEQGMGGPEATGSFVEGYFNAVDRVYAAAHSPAAGGQWLEIIAPNRDGGSLTCTDADRDGTVFAQRLPDHPLLALPGGSPAELMGLLREHRDADASEANGATAGGFAEYYMARDADLRDWILDAIRTMRDADLALRDRVLEAGLVDEKDMDAILFAHDRLAMWQVGFLLTARRLWSDDLAEANAEAREYMTPRHVIAYVAENPARGRARLKHVASLDEPLPADVYLVQS